MNQGPSPLFSFFPILLMFLVFYFLLIRPQQKQQARHQEMIKNLSKNDEVVTSGGIHGTVVGLKEESVLLRVAENVKIEVERSAITKVQKSRTEEQGIEPKRG
ncbi:MAG: preprotein translocase subunit YajC [Candidatus Omnitrophica bacterium]|nr:preprotein translocase subunit YajC [Candidatus Omnitrophota bacterium]